ncbi:hypothetical protein Tco_1206551 [Tanacetum coccineum]
MIQNPDKPDDPKAQIIEPLSKMTESTKKQYFEDIRVMNFILQGIPNDIYNFVNACKNAQQMYGRRIIILFIDYEEDYQGEIQGNAQEDKLTTAMMLLARGITQRYSTPINNRLRTSSNTRNQAVIQDGRVDIQSKNVGYAGNDDKDDAEPTYDADALGEVNASQIHLKSRMHSESVHEHTNHAKLKTNINTSDNDQIDSSIIFDDPYVDKNGGTDEHDSNAHDQFVALESLIYNERVRTLEKQPIKSLNYKEAYEELEQEIRVDKDKIDNLIKEKDKIQDENFQLEHETVKIRHEIELSKKAFKEREKSYLDELVDLGEKLSSHDRIVYKIGKAIQTIHMLEKKQTSIEMLDLLVKKMPNESKLLKLFVKLDKSIGDLQTQIDQTLLKDITRALIFDDQDELRQFYKTGVIPMYISLSRCSNEIKQEIIEEVQEILDIFESMEKKVEQQSQKDKIFQNEIDRLLDTSLTREIRDCVLLSIEKQKNEMLILKREKASNDSKDIQATMEQRIHILENDFKRVEAQYVNLDLKMQHQKKWLVMSLGSKR